MSLVVIGAGFQKTGTSSLQAALNTLGFSCAHGSDVHSLGPSKRAFLPLLRQKLHGVPVDVGSLVLWLEEHGFNAVCDFPFSLFWEELHAAFPDAKVVLTVREASGWFRSRREMLAFERGSVDVIHRLLALFDRNKAALAPFLDLIEEVAYGVPLMAGPSLEDPALAQRYIDRYDQHNRSVIETIPKDKLLVFDVAQGWKPLCAFLNVPEPKVPFPKENMSLGGIKALVRKRRKEGMKKVAWRVGLLLGFAALGVCFKRRGFAVH